MSSKSVTIITLFQVFAIFGTILFSTLGNSLGKEGMWFPISGPSDFPTYGFYILIVPIGWLIATGCGGDADLGRFSGAMANCGIGCGRSRRGWDKGVLSPRQAYPRWVRKSGRSSEL